ncbi:M14 family zinc carboxypeptidase [Streptosporangium sp. OZ121]|uniref:M14 family zinc carboxypeptidase n=1 Tax=Streptosporangium sp. OZ121 TaxID=3444183 RepID=UPI003F7913E9
MPTRSFPSRRIPLVVSLAAASLLAWSSIGAAMPPDPADRGNGSNTVAERDEIAALDHGPRLSGRPAGVNRPDHAQSYPRRTQLRTYPENPDDESIELGLAPYHALAPKLNLLQSRGDRVSVEVVGESALGRDLYLVTLTAPESVAETSRQTAWRQKIENDPVAAAADQRLRREYKTPLWINANIHGNEWEGTDGALRVIEYLATTDDGAAKELLRRNRIYFNLTANPDGRVTGDRNNANGFNLNRDFVTASQAETRAMREILIRTQPLVVLDEHGYVPNTLIEPTTPPHGQNYDFDLYIKHGLAVALDMEEAVKALGHPEAAQPEIPFRDYAPGDWDGWAPIYTAQYAMYHGAVSATVEIPLEVNGQPPGTDLKRRSAINTDVVQATIRRAMTYVDENRHDLIANQIEMFRRGAAGEKQRLIPDGFVPGFGPEDRYTTEFPRAYVIPVGTAQRSATAAARLVDHLVANDVRVRRADAPFTLGGRDYPAGSYLVDMRQPKRGLANVMLETGSDISRKVPDSFDIAAWSHRLLWGASVDVIHSGAVSVPGRDVMAASPTGGVDGPAGRDLAITLVDAREAGAINDLIERGVALRRRTDGTFVVPAGDRGAAVEVAERHGVRFAEASPGEIGAPVERPVLAAAVAADELVALRGMGFDARPVSTALLNAGFDWSDIDVLMVSSGLRLTELNTAARDALRGFLARGGVITRGATGSAFNAEAGLLTVQAVAGPGRASGVVSVSHDAGGLFGAEALPHSFVYRPQWFTGLGPEVTVRQRYAPGTPLVAGHWVPFTDGTGGPDQAAGQAAVVSGTSGQGARVVMFGTEPLLRDHTKGLFAQVAHAVYWITAR